MSRRRKRTERCPATNDDGTRCARMLAAGDVLCHIHLRGPVGAALAAKQARLDAERESLQAIDALTTDQLPILLKRLTHDPDPAIRLRAIEALLRHEERQTGCPTCAARAARPFANMDAVVAKATEDQRQQLRAHLAAIKAIKQDILGIPAHSEGAARQELTNGPEQPHDQPTGTSAEVPESPDHDHAEHVEDIADEEELSADRQPVGKPTVQEYDALGLITLADGTVTHPLGDDTAHQILNGTISREDAKGLHDNAVAKQNRMFGSLSHIKKL
jgi:hypothetical protein